MSPKNLSQSYCAFEQAALSEYENLVKVSLEE